MKIAPSLLAADFSALADSVSKIESSADFLHLDVMDGHFVPNISFGPGVIAALRPLSKLFFDVHLMIEHPERYLSAFRKAGADGITVHLETLRDPAATLDEIRTLGAAPALAISPETPVEALLPFLPLCNMVLVMTVHPGFGGQALMPQALAKATVLKEKISQLGLNCLVEADGGIKPANLATVRAAGVDVAVAGSAVFGAADPAAVIAEMKKI